MNEINTVAGLIKYLQTLPPDATVLINVDYGDYYQSIQKVELNKDYVDYNASEKVLYIGQ